MNETCFRVNTPAVIYEQFDDELVAINLDTGAYHSLVGAAADAFLLLSEEATIEELSHALARKYAATAEQIRAALPVFIDQLREENLIAVVEVRRRVAPLRLAGDQTGVPFVPPHVAAYHDLESLFLLDPIHDVGEQGWPQPAQQPLDDKTA
jgi:hypothetical protein